MASFATQLWDKADLIIKTSQDRRRQIEQFITVLNKRIDAEQTYAKTVQEAAKVAEKIRQGQQNMSSLAFASFKFDCVNRCSQARTFAKSLKDEVMIPLKQLLTEQNQQAKQAEKDYKKMQKQLSDLQYQIIKNKNKFDQEYKQKLQTIMTNQILVQSSKTSKQKRAKTISKSTDIMNNLIELQSMYQKSVNDYNDFLNQYYAQLYKILETYQKHQESRLSRQQQNIMKMLVFQTSMMKNFEYDIITITKQVQKSKQRNDIKQFIDKNQTGKTKLTQKDPNVQKDMLGVSLFKISNKDFQKKIFLQINKQFKTYIQKRFKGEEATFILFQQGQLKQFENIFSFISQAWKGQGLTFEQWQKLKKMLNDQNNRFAFYKYLQQYLLTFNVSMTQDGYNEIILLLIQIINKCYVYKDVFISRKITNLTFSYYTIKQDQKKYLHYGLNQCQIFHSIDYWKASAFQSVQQELYLHFGDKLQQQLQMRELSLVLGQLAMYCHQMILLGVSTKSVRQTIGWFCRLYSIPDDQNRDLAKTVSLSVKRYRQIFHLTQTAMSVQSNPKSQKQIKQSIEQIQQSKPTQQQKKVQEQGKKIISFQKPSISEQK